MILLIHPNLVKYSVMGIVIVIRFFFNLVKVRFCDN